MVNKGMGEISDWKTSEQSGKSKGLQVEKGREVGLGGFPLKEQEVGWEGMPYFVGQHWEWWWGFGARPAILVKVLLFASDRNQLEVA